jgi:hypothetical protein
LGVRPSPVFGQEIGEHPVLVFLAEVDQFDFDAEHVGDGQHVLEILADGAVLFQVVRFPVLHEHAHHLVALPLEQPGGDGGIDTAGEADDDAAHGAAHVKVARVKVVVASVMPPPSKSPLPPLCKRGESATQPFHQHSIEKPLSKGGADTSPILPPFRKGGLGGISGG